MSDNEPTCACCGDTFDRSADRATVVEDRYALHSGYNLGLEGDDDRYLACPGCTDRIGFDGEVFVVAYPQYADDPEAGDLTIHRGVVYSGVLSDDPRTDAHSPIEPEGNVFDLIAAYHLDRDLPVEWPRRFSGVPDDAPEWRKLGGNWHSSLESSEVSDRVNALARGDVGIYGPVLIHYGETRNVCSQPVSVYAPEGLEYWDKRSQSRRPITEYFEGAQSTPAGAFQAR